jgi:phosphoribosylformylglycinamidine synthase subunit PurL
MKYPSIPISQISDSSELEAKLRSLHIGMSSSEALKVVSILGRDPTIVELFIFDIEWSEHCSYKSSKKILKKYLPTQAGNVILGPGEDSGIIRFTEADGVPYALVVAHESHNHPSQLLPVEGAATGIGGIVRDVDCMGAHVFAVADGLRFGDPSGENIARTRWLVRGVVDGIWQYGNALGVPNLAGDVYFDSSFDDNCLVNVICAGIVKEEEIIRSRVPMAATDGDYDLILVGKATDPSGFGGVTFASEILDESEESERIGSVQVHDPFLKNILIMKKANRMVMDLAAKEKIPIGMKDLGGGGLACASSEICHAGGFGAVIYLDKVHTAIQNLHPEIIACSETQERFIFAVPPHFTQKVLQIYNQIWNLPEEANGAMASLIGHSTTDMQYKLFFNQELVCDAPVDQITSGIEYDRLAKPIHFSGQEPPPQKILNYCDILRKLIASPNICSRYPIYHHYDTEVQGGAVIRPGEADAGVLAPLEIEGISSAAVALSVDGNPFIGEINPYWGGAVSVAESMRNVIAAGGVPRCLTDCLNYGNPEIPEAFWQFEQGVKGIADAARNLWQIGTDREPVPVVSGNVSFYNESAVGRAIKPSPIIACFGILKDYSKAMTLHFKSPGNLIVMVGERRDEMGGSAYYREIHGVKGMLPVTVKWEQEHKDMLFVHEILDRCLVESCHDIADGGFLIALTEMLCFLRKPSTLGAEIDILNSTLPDDHFLFSETGGFLLEIRSENWETARDISEKFGANPVIIGKTTSEGLLNVTINNIRYLSEKIQDLSALWKAGLEEIIQ